MKHKEWCPTCLQNERDENGLLTPLALALDAIADCDLDCDCGNDEPGTCLVCCCENALRDLWEKLQQTKSNCKYCKLEKNCPGFSNCPFLQKK
jgi:hypothetical protein